MRTKLEQVWRKSKSWRSVNLGPIALTFRMRRSNKRPNKLHISKSFAINHLKNVFLAAQQKPSSNIFELPRQETEKNKEIAVIFGLGKGYGYGLVHEFVKNGMSVAMVCRNPTMHTSFVAELLTGGANIKIYSADATDELSVSQTFDSIEKDFGTPNLVVTCFQGFAPGKTTDVEVCAFEESWRQNCLGPFIVGKKAAQLMTPKGKGTIIFTGATSGTIGRAGYLNLSVGKHGLRAMAQVMAKELHPQGIHVAHVIIDAEILRGEQEEEEIYMYPNEIAETVYFVHSQPKSAWTHELDARPWNEAFWEHC